MRWNIACWISLIALFLLAGCGDSTSVECTTDTDCEGTLVCRDGRCVPEPECETDADCLGKAPPICHLSENPQCVEGACQFAQAPAGTACEDGDLCTRDTSCDAAGQCGGGSPTCVAPDAECIGSVCREYSASCYELTGECSYPYTETDYESVDECHAHCGTCVPSCEGLPCGSGDGCGGTCEQGSGCICSCEGKICGEEDGCGNVCEEGSGCISPDCEVEGDLCFGNCRVCDENLQCTRDDDALCTGDCDFCFEGNCEPDDGMCDTEQCEFCRGSGTEFNCVSDLPTAPTVSASENPICAGGSTSLEVEADEEEDYEYEWFEGSCAGNPIHECHDMICDVSPEVTTSYYVRRIHPGCPQPSECASVTVQVDPASAGGAVSGGTTPINLGSDTGAMTLGGHVGAVVRWERRVDGGAWEPIDVQTTTYSDTP
ncbi:MAG: hypothetical protein JXR96_08900, partial [Deltaproteobacteria bacterium]|nr:hypothetical protein [Deltaproteobacteria bacterium]